MKKLLITVCALAGFLNANAQFIEKVNFVGALDKDPAKDWTKNWTQWNPKAATYSAPTDSTTLNDASGQKEITSNLTLSSKEVYLLTSMVVVKSGAKLTIPAGTLILGRANTSATPKQYATIVVERGGQIDIQGTENSPVIITSSKAANSRDRGDWGGLVICGKATNNQGNNTQVEGFNNVSFNNQLAFHGGTDDADNSGSISYLRLEFAGFAFEPNKEINAITLGSVGSKTSIHHIQVSYSGDDSYEWFGGTVNLKYIIAYKGTDDDFDADFGYRGAVQFGIAQKDTAYFDLTWNVSGGSTSETFECDNDAAGSGLRPLTSASFVNMTCVGPVPIGRTYASMGSTSKGAFRRGARIRRNSRISITNSIFMGYRNFVMFDGDSTLIAAGVKPSVKVSNTNNIFRNNYILNTSSALNTKTSTANGLSEVSTGSSADSLSKWILSSVNNNQVDKATYTTGTVLVDPQNATSPDFRPVSTNKDLFGTTDYTANNFANYGTFVVCDSITKQPKSVTLKTSENALFTFEYTGSDATFQWQAATGSSKFANLVNGGQYSGTTNDSLSVSNITIQNNGEKFRCMISSRWCKDSTAVASITAILRACNLITTQPKAVEISSGSDAAFKIAVNDNNASINWQADFDLGMQDIPTGNAKYTNANTSDLTVKSVGLRNHKQAFRAIAANNVCIDTSNTVELSIADTCINTKSISVTDTLIVNLSVKVNNITKSNNIKVYPIPTQSTLTIDNGDFAIMGGYTIKIFNTVGTQVYSQSITQQQYTVDLSSYTLGVYFLAISNPQGTEVARKTIVLQ